MSLLVSAVVFVETSFVDRFAFLSTEVPFDSSLSGITGLVFDSATAESADFPVVLLGVLAFELGAESLVTLPRTTGFAGTLLDTELELLSDVLGLIEETFVLVDLDDGSLLLVAFLGTCF